MKPSHDLTNLIAFSQREGVWPELLASVLDEHFGPALEEFDLDFDDLEKVLGRMRRFGPIDYACS